MLGGCFLAVDSAGTPQKLGGTSVSFWPVLSVTQQATSLLHSRWPPWIWPTQIMCKTIITVMGSISGTPFAAHRVRHPDADITPDKTLAAAYAIETCRRVEHANLIVGRDCPYNAKPLGAPSPRRLGTARMRESTTTLKNAKSGKTLCSSFSGCSSWKTVSILSCKSSFFHEISTQFHGAVNTACSRCLSRQHR